MKSLQNLSYKTLFTILFFSLAGIIFFLRIGKPTNKVSAAWWDEMWHYRKAISIENSSGSDLTDFQVSISVGTSALIASGKMQSDCDDIRITDINGNILPHWIEENNPGCNQLTDTKIWLKANSLPTSGATIYIYYGNQQADNSENGDNVFEFFDDFSRDLNKWIIVSNSSWSISNEILNITPPSNNNYIVANKSIGTSELIIEARLKSNHTSGLSHPGIIWHANTLTFSNHRNDQIYVRPHSYNTSSNVQPGYFNGSLSTFSNTTGLFNYNTWYNIKIEIPTSNSIKYYRNDTNEANFANQQYQNNTYTGLVAHSGSNMQFDNFRVRKYASSDPIPSLQSEELSPAPIAYWKFDEGVGTTAYDSTGNSNGTLGSGSSTPTWVSEDQCISGKCLEFDNGNKYVALQNYPILGTSSWTISAWVKIPTNVTGRVGTFFGNFNNSPTINLEVHDDGQLRYYWNAQIDQFGTTDLRDNQWHYITFIRDKNNNKSYMYIDGIIEKIINSSGSDLNLSGNFWIGSDQRVGGLPWHGLIDEVKIYSYARTADQIKQDYNSRGSMSGSSVNLGVRSNTTPSLKSSLIAYYKFDEGNGTFVNNSISGGIGSTAIFGPGASAPTWSNNGKFGKSLKFETGYIKQPNYGISAGGEISFVFWINPNNTENLQLLISKYDAFNIGITSGYISGRIYNGTVITTSIWATSTGCAVRSLINSGWHHIAFTAGGGYLKLFVDGIEKNRDDWSGATYSPGWDNRIGAGSVYGWNPFDGYLDEVKIYNRALTAEEVKQDYNQGSVAQFGSTNQTIGGTTTSLEYCIPGDTSYCAPPVAQWNFEENTGTTAKDTSGNNNNGTFGTGNSAPTWSLGQNNKGTGVNFINNASYIDNSSIIYGDSYTTEAWIKPTDLGIIDGFGRTIISSSPTTSSYYPIWLLLRGSQIRAYSYSNSTASYFIDSNFNNIQTNNWYHISLTAIKNGQANLYINGTLDSTFTAGAQAAAQKLTIADLRPGRNISFKGSIDQVKIYNYIRTPAQITYDYNRGAPIGHWKLDECQGSTAFDSSGLGNTGTIIIGASGSQNSLGTCAVGTSAAWTNGTSGKINSSLNFDGTDDFIQIPNVISGNNTHTISFWAKPQKSTIVWLDMSGDSGYSFIETATNNLYVGYSPTTSQYRSYSFPFSNNIWYHITIVKTGSGNNLNAYINGKLLTSYSGSVGDMNSGSIMYIGKFHNTGYSVQGQIDDVRIYNYALTAEQVKQVYNGGAVNFN